MGKRTAGMMRFVTRVYRRFPHAGLVAILGVYFILATLYSVIVPLAQGDDELAHYRYIKFIAQTGRLPLDYVEREQAWYRADWPPLYHLLVGWTVSPLDTTRPQLKDVGESPRRRLVGEIYYPRLIIYTEDVNWPWQDGILAWHLGRFISILLAGGALAFTYFTVLELCRDTKDASLDRPCAPVPWLPLAVTTTALLAFMPRYLFTSAMLGDDSLFILLSAVFIWLLLRALRGDDRWWIYAVLGLLLGLSLATKYSTALLPLAIIPVVWWRARQASWRWWQGLGRIVVAWLAVLVGVSWWFAWIGRYFNTIDTDGPILGLFGALLNTGPDVSMRRIFAVFTADTFTGPERPGAIEAGTFWEWSTYFFQTFWGVPVLEYDPLFPWVYLLGLVFCLLALVGLWRVSRAANSETRVSLGVLALIVVLLILFPILRFFLTHNVLETGQGRHLLYPAGQAIPILLMLGWTTFNIKRPALNVLPALFLLLWSGFLLIYMRVTYPAPLPVQTTTFAPTSIPHEFQYDFGDDIQLLGYDLDLDRAHGLLELTLFWRSDQPAPENYRTQIQLVDPDGQTRLTWLSHPLNGRYPTRAWEQGDVIRDALSLPLFGLPPDRYTAQLDVLHEAEDISLTNQPVIITAFELPTAPPPVNAATLGDVVYRLWSDDKPVRQRQALPLSWRYSDDQGTKTQPGWALVGPDNQPRLPAAMGDGSAVFMIGADWPSGDYRLQLQVNGAAGQQTEPLLTVANEARVFDLSPLPEGFIPVEVTFVDAAGKPQVKLLGYTLSGRRAEPGGGFSLTLYWQSLAPVLADTLTFVVLLDANLHPYGSIDRYAAGFYSPILWAEGEVVTDDFIVPVQPDASPGVYSLHLGQYHLQNGQPEYLTLQHEDEPTEQTAVVIEPLKVGGPPPGVMTTSAVPQVTLNQPLGNQVTLLGYDVRLEDGQLELTLYWRAETDLQADYTTFLHLRNRANETVAQKDNPPAGGRYPTSLWSAGEIIVDEIILPLDGVLPGQYTPVVGLYEFASGTRLAVPGSPANEVALEALAVKE